MKITPRKSTAMKKGRRAAAGETKETTSGAAKEKTSGAAPADKPAAVDRMEKRRGPKLLLLPDVRQALTYTCGAASLQAILVYFGKSDDRELYLADELNTSSDWGTEPKDIKRVAEEFGLKVKMRERLTLDELRDYVEQGIPVMVAYQAWREDGKQTPWKEDWEDGHYSVVVGVDDDNVYLEDPSLIGEIGFIPRDEFMERWHDIDKTGRKLRQFGIIFESRKKPPKLGRLRHID